MVTIIHVLLSKLKLIITLFFLQTIELPNAFCYIIKFYYFFRYVSLLSEHHRIILCGPSGTGKSYLSNKLAEFLVLKMGKECNSSTIVTFRLVIIIFIVIVSF